MIDHTNYVSKTSHSGHIQCYLQIIMRLISDASNLFAVAKMLQQTWASLSFGTSQLQTHRERPFLIF